MKTSVWGKESLPSAPLMSLGSDSETKRITLHYQIPPAPEQTSVGALAVFRPSSKFAIWFKVVTWVKEILEPAFS